VHTKMARALLPQDRTGQASLKIWLLGGSGGTQRNPQDTLCGIHGLTNPSPRPMPTSLTILLWTTLRSFWDRSITSPR